MIVALGPEYILCAALKLNGRSIHGMLFLAYFQSLLTLIVLCHIELGPATTKFD